MSWCLSLTAVRAEFMGEPTFHKYNIELISCFWSTCVVNFGGVMELLPHVIRFNWYLAWNHSCSDAQLSAQTSMYFGAHLTFHDVLCSLYIAPLVSQKNKPGGLGIFWKVICRTRNRKSICAASYTWCYAKCHILYLVLVMYSSISTWTCAYSSFL